MISKSRLGERQTSREGVAGEKRHSAFTVRESVSFFENSPEPEDDLPTNQSRWWLHLRRYFL